MTDSRYSGRHGRRHHLPVSATHHGLLQEQPRLHHGHSGQVCERLGNRRALLPPPGDLRRPLLPLPRHPRSPGRPLPSPPRPAPAPPPSPCPEAPCTMAARPYLPLHRPASPPAPRPRGPAAVPPARHRPPGQAPCYRGLSPSYPSRDHSPWSEEPSPASPAPGRCGATCQPARTQDSCEARPAGRVSEGPRRGRDARRPAL